MMAKKQLRVKVCDVQRIRALANCPRDDAKRKVFGKGQALNLTCMLVIEVRVLLDSDLRAESKTNLC